MDINKIIADIQAATEQIAQTLQKIKTSQQRFDALETTHNKLNTIFLDITKQLENQQDILIAAQEKANNTQLQTIDKKFISLNKTHEESVKKLAETITSFEYFINATKDVWAANKALGTQIAAIDFPKRFEENAKIWQQNITAQNKEIAALNLSVKSGQEAQNKEIAALNLSIKSGQEAQKEQIKALKVADLLEAMTIQVEKLAQTVGSVKEKIQETQLKIQETQTNLARLVAAQSEPFNKIQAQLAETKAEIQTQAQRQNVLIYALWGLVLILLLVVIFKS